MVQRSTEDQQRLGAAYASYDGALLRRDLYEIAAARLHLVRVLVATGWQAPQEVRDQVLRDEKTLRRRAEVESDPRADLLRPPSHRQPPHGRTRE